MANESSCSLLNHFRFLLLGFIMDHVWKECTMAKTPQVKIGFKTYGIGIYVTYGRIFVDNNN